MRDKRKLESEVPMPECEACLGMGWWHDEKGRLHTCAICQGSGRVTWADSWQYYCDMEG